MKHKEPKKINDRATVQKLVELIDVGKAKVVKEFIHGDPIYTIQSASGTVIGVPSIRYLFVFKAILERRSDDGLFPGMGQST